MYKYIATEGHLLTIIIGMTCTCTYWYIPVETQEHKMSLVVPIVFYNACAAADGHVISTYNYM